MLLMSETEGSAGTGTSDCATESSAGAGVAGINCDVSWVSASTEAGCSSSEDICDVDKTGGKLGCCKFNENH